jgi:hypothetical protein
MEEAANLGFWVVPSLPLADGSDGSGRADTFLTVNSTLGRTVSRLRDHDAVLFWQLGPGGLAREQAAAAARTAQVVRAVDPQRPLAADVWDGFGDYSRSVQLLGAHRWPLMTALEIPQYREWLNQRRLLANSNTVMWTWIQTHLPDWHTNLAYDRSGGPGFDEPVGPLPEQVRLLTYAALASGCRGLGFWSDRFLANSHQGRDRLQAMALLNQELQMLEPLLVAADAPKWIDTSAGEVKAAVFHAEGAVLVLPMWTGYGAQYVPGQAAKANLSIIVPQVPPAMQAWEVSPGDVRSLKVERVRGGSKVTLPEFGVTSAVVFTGDNSQTGLLVYLQDEARKRRKLAAQWAHDLAEAELDKVARIYAQLEEAGHPVRDGRERLEDARKRLQVCVDRWNDGDYREAYLEARRAVRPLGILMRDAWEEAARDLDSPTASPYAVSYFTLPRHWRFVDQVKASGPGATVLPGGDFELTPDRPADAWTPQETTLDEVELAARRVSETPQEGRQCLLLEIKPKNPLLPPEALERTYLALHSPAVRLEPGTLVRLSAWVRIPEKIAASPDGALLYDSAGGEPLAVRLTNSTKRWEQLTWYRRVPASGTINVTLALTGLGKVYFDDVRIEPLLPGQGTLTADAGQSLRSPKRPKPGEVVTERTATAGERRP